MDNAVSAAPVRMAAASQEALPVTQAGLGQRIRQYGRRVYRRHQGKLLVLAGMGMTFVILGAYDAIKGPNLPLTPKEFVEAVNLVVDERPAPPSRAAVAYANAISAVVSISGYDPSEPKAGPPSPTGDEPDDPFEVIGTGVVVQADGTILTNLHVAGSVPRLRVTFANGMVTDAYIIGAQPDNDLAVLRVSMIPADLEPATMASASSLRPGDEVVAIGFPFGVGPSVSAGVVSGLGRAFGEPGRPIIDNLIQYDAATNPGNSGGPLLNANGEVVGIVTALMNPSGSRTFAGIGFAVTIDTAAGALGDNPL
jgi:S1-C subfamily serine protease